MLDIREILRRLQLGQGHRAIARDLGTSRKTVAKYHSWAQAEGLLVGPLPDAGRLQSVLAPASASRPRQARKRKSISAPPGACATPATDWSRRPGPS